MYFNKSLFLQILYLSPIIIMKWHESGFQKRKKKQQLQQQLHEIPKWDKFIIHTYKEETAPEQDSSPQIESTELKGECSGEQNLESESVCKLEEEISQLSPSISPHVEVKQRDVSSDENEEQKETENQSSNDLSKWNSLSDEDRTYWIDKGPSDCQHWNDNFAKSKCIFKNQNRYCSKGIFQGVKANGEKFSREWLVYSPSTGCVFCIVCRLFSSSSGALVTHGFSDWKTQT